MAASNYQRYYQKAQKRRSFRAARIRAQVKHREARRKLLRSLKDKPCADCGEKFPYECMDFDHVRGRKTFELSHCGGVSIERLMREVAKCDLVCANCHRTRTKVRRRK